MMPGMPADAMADETRKVRRPRPKSEVVKARDLDWSTVRRDVWIWAGTPVDEPYPCMCQAWIEVTGYSRCGRLCPDAGRADTEHLPPSCCAVLPAGRRQTGSGQRAPIPLAPIPRRSKLVSPRPVTAADVISALAGGR